MTILYAQATAAWANASWNTQANGLGTPQAPVNGDECNANTFTIDCADVATSNFTLVNGGGTFISTKWYAQDGGPWEEVPWTCDAAGQGKEGSPVSGNTCNANGQPILCNDVVMTGLILVTGGGSFYLTVGYAKTNGAIATVVFNGRMDGTGLDQTAAQITGTIATNGKHLTGDIVDIGTWTLDGSGGGSYTLGIPPSTWPAASNVSDVETAYGPTGAEYHGDLDLDLYTLTSGIVWPAAANVSDVETAYGPTGAEYHGDLDLDLYTLTSGIVWPASANVSDIETAYGPTGTEYHGDLDLSLYVLIDDIDPVIDTSSLVILADNKFSNPVYVKDYEAGTLTASANMICQLCVSDDGLTWRSIVADFIHLIKDTAWPLPTYIFNYTFMRLQIIPTVSNRTLDISLSNLIYYTG